MYQLTKFAPPKSSPSHQKGFLSRVLMLVIRLGLFRLLTAFLKQMSVKVLTKIVKIKML